MPWLMASRSFLFIRMSTQGIPLLALTGGYLSPPRRSLYKFGRKFYSSALGETCKQGIIGSHFFSSSNSKLSWFIHTPRFFERPDWYSHAFLALIKQEF